MSKRRASIITVAESAYSIAYTPLL